MNQLSITHFPALDYACDEAMNTLCTNLSYSGPGIRTVLFTSRYEQEGKSGITMNVMRTLAGYGKRVLLVDADLRRSTLARRYRFNYSQREAFGLVHYLAGMCALEEVVYQTNLPGAYILPAGRDVFNSMQLLTSPLYGEMMRAMRERFDMVLVDSPPRRGHCGRGGDREILRRRAHCGGLQQGARAGHRRGGRQHRQDRLQGAGRGDERGQPQILPQQEVLLPF